jgi:hypothetical protein
MRLRASEFLFLSAVSLNLAACNEGAQEETSSGGEAGTGGSGGTGGTAGTAGSGFGGNAFNQCGVAAPLPADTGQCTAVSAPIISDFDDSASMTAEGYTYYVNGAPPAEHALLGAIQHVGDGSDMNDAGASVISTEMVVGEGDAGYALQISNSNAMNWGGLLMFYFPYEGTTPACLDARGYAGVEFSIKGASPSGKFGVMLGMLDTTPSGDNGLCDSAVTDDCKQANLELSLPSDAATWTRVQVPWSSFTPGVGSAGSCVPVTGQNIMRLVIQPFMTYPPPDYMFAPGPYTIAVDNLRFY